MGGEGKVRGQISLYDVPSVLRNSIKPFTQELLMTISLGGNVFSGRSG
jgi:hypothetical protein